MIAATHFLQTRDAHFGLAAGLDQGVQENSAESGARVTQKAA